MDAPTLQPKFLKNGSDLGIVAVGFSGGQVSNHANRVVATEVSDSIRSVNPVSMPRPWPS
jgi:hypothetical protein